MATPDENTPKYAERAGAPVVLKALTATKLTLYVVDAVLMGEQKAT
jgi:hypothetical protein